MTFFGPNAGVKSAKENKVIDSCVALGMPPLYVPGLGQLRFAYRKPPFGEIHAFGMGTLNDSVFLCSEPSVSAPFPFAPIPGDPSANLFVIRQRVFSGDYETPETGEYC